MISRFKTLFFLGGLLTNSGFWGSRVLKWVFSCLLFLSCWQCSRSIRTKHSKVRRGGRPGRRTINSWIWTSWTTDGKYAQTRNWPNQIEFNRLKLNETMITIIKQNVNKKNFILNFEENCIGMDFLTCTLIFCTFFVCTFFSYAHFCTFFCTCILVRFSVRTFWYVFDTYVHLYKYLFFQLFGFVVRIRSFLKKIKLF